jgi:hypothetical protein
MSTISGFGLSIDPLPGWYGEIYRTVDGLADTGPIVHVANTPLILGDRDAYAPSARRTMREADAILCVVNLPSLPNIVTAEGVERKGAGEPWSLDGASSAPFSGVDNAHSSLRKGLQVGERAFDVIVFFGSTRPSVAVLRDLASMLKGVRVDLKPPRGGGEGVEQYFSVAAALRINDEIRRKMWARDSAYASADEVAEHASAFPGG